jgi:pyruvate formate lyase activating enzyme
MQVVMPETQPEQPLIGKVHSFETLATLDGPGLRTVVFLQGCPLRCKFCHNVDSTLTEGGTEYTVDALVEKVLRNKVYWESYSEPSAVADAGVPGGVTISGGDPVFQPKFLVALATALKAEGVHLAIDTSLATTPKLIDALLPLIDLWMISVKEFDVDKHIALTGVPNLRIQQNIRYLDDQITARKLPQSPRIRHRFVVIPGLTDYDKLIHQLGEHCSKINNFEVLELLAYSSLGKHKWIECFGKYDLEHIRDGEKPDLDRVAKLLEPYGVPLKY